MVSTRKWCFQLFVLTVEDTVSAGVFTQTTTQVRPDSQQNDKLPSLVFVGVDFIIHLFCSTAATYLTELFVIH